MDDFELYDDLMEDDGPSDPISFFAEEIYFEPANPELLRRWIEEIVSREKRELIFINYVFCDDPYLLKLNQEYLQHDTLTDIITFPYHDPPIVEGDVFISVDRIHDNAHQFGVTFEQELHRVMIHGVLHLCGYPDKAPEEKARMTEKEDEALNLLKTLVF
ncbi:rRNA maturation RNase YbeY [Haliscomenobacter hydrossis]|uniref:Endoribonuclease YbeY n=1 Tax=Haliscomenobacter hydrossis (strain ATCC 27775 / DSM 1100 / LMG 10767 / O) TaxID=760192 RepID=F4KYJ5_HALH1|nr:rRNA maturation RNase YbeY [Haliscomenobacter hydrossis]AEE50401.1 metalloprotease ybeY [Haliscomenobacter hydrossis DSM 1100]